VKIKLTIMNRKERTKTERLKLCGNNNREQRKARKIKNREKMVRS
jgi:hypothetical protein